MKRLNIWSLLTLALLITGFNINAQSEQFNPSISGSNLLQNEPCGFDAIHQEMMQNNPVYFQKTIEFNNFMKSYVPDQTKVSSTNYRIPVVVHVMETGNSLTQITDQQIRDGIKALNERYRKVPGSAGDGNGVDVEIEFTLAVRDPSNNCTNGIVRYNMTGNSTYMSSGVYSNSAGISDASLKALSVWNQTQYYNIWLVSEIDNNDGGAGIQGYAYFASSHGMSNDGAVILVNNFKDYSSTTGAHEIGHALNLYHTFEGDGGGGSCPPNTTCTTQGDRCCDTPPHRRSNSDCVVGTNSCTGGSSDQHIHNYMDYSSDACQSEFSNDQRSRMVAALTTTRASFLATNGNMSLVPPAIANISFTASSDFICQGNTVQFIDFSSCIPNTYLDSTYWTGITFNWTFANGVNTYNSTLQNPIMTFPIAGTYDVTLQITNSYGTSTLTQTEMVAVGTSPVSACTPNSSNAGNYWNTVNGVTFNTISNNTSSYDNVAYTDFSCDANTIVTDGTSYPISVDVRAGGSGSEFVEVYIDYNNNGVFENPSELVLSGNSGGTNTTATISGNVTIPGSAVQNTLLRMRVYGDAASITAGKRSCSSNFFIGDVEDYGVFIRPVCTAPAITSNPTSMSVCENGNASFSTSNTGTNPITHQWQLSTNGGGAWSNVSDGGVYSGATTTNLTINGALIGMNTYQYRCVVSNTCGTVNSNAATLTVNTNPAITIASTSDPSVCATATGSIQIGGSGTGTLTWSGPVNGSNPGTSLPFTVSNLSAGSYTIDLVDANSCASNTLVQVLNDPSAPTAPVISAGGSTTFCDGGSVTLTSSYGSGNTWSTTETNASIVVTTAGSYTVMYTDGGGCSSTSNPIVITVNALPSAPTISTSGSTTICPGSNVDLISSETSGNTWSTSELTQTITVNTPGSYTVQFTDGNGCTSAASAPTVVTSSGASAAILPLTEGFTAATFPPTDWNMVDAGGPDNWVRSIAVGNAPTPGNSLMFDNYTNDNTGFNDEMWVKPVNLVGYSSIQLAFDVAYAPYDATYNDGLEVLISTDCGVTFTSLFSWSYLTLATDAATTSSYAPGNWRNETIDLTAYSGNQSAIVAFRNLAGYGNNLYIDNINITGTQSVNADFTSAPNPVCIGQTVTYTDASTDATSWSWNFGAGATPATATGVGPHNVTYSSAGTKSVSLSINGGASTSNQNVVVNAMEDASFNYNAASYCTNESNPIASITGTTGGTFSSSPAGLSINASSGTISLAACTPGTYAVTYTTPGTCSSLSSVNVTIDAAPADPTISPDGPTAFCTGGSVNLTSSYPSNITWTPSGVGQTINVNNSGSFTVTYSDVNGCSSTSSPVVVSVNNVPAAPSVSVVDNCGSSDLTATGSNLLWSTSETTSTINVTTPGSYTVTQTVGGCTSSPSTANANPAPNSIISTGSVNEPSVCGASDGNIEITGTGTGNLNWSGSAIGSANGITLPYIVNGLSAGSYTFTFNIGGCASNNLTTSLSDPGAPAAPSVSVVDNCGSSDLTASGTNLVWSTTETSAVITVSTPGTYTVTQNVGGCTSAPASISANPNTQPAAPSVSVTDNCGNSVLTASGTNILWSTTETNPTISVPTAGTYTVTQTVGGCTSAPASVNANPGTPPAAPIATVTDGCGSSVLSATGSNLSWSTSETTSSITVSTSGPYSVTQTIGGCTSSPTTVTASPFPNPTAPTISTNGSTTFCQGESVDLISSQATGITWSTSETSQTITVVSNGTYSVSYTDGNGCSASSSSVTVNVDQAPSPVVTPSGTTTFCEGGNVILSSSVGSGITWSNGQTAQSIVVSTSDSYTVTAVNGSGCSGTSSPIVVTVNPSPTITFEDLDTTCVFSSTFALSGGTPTGGTYNGPSVSSNQFNPAAAGVGAHTLSYTYTNGNGCSNTANAIIVVDGCTGIENLTNDVINMYPNPVSSTVTISTNENLINNVKIFDESGRLVEYLQCNSIEVQFNVQNLSMGIYHVEINTDNGQYQRRLVKH